MEQLNKNFVFSNEIACNERILKILVSHCVIVDAYQFINVQFILLNLMWCARSFTKGPQIEFAIVKITTCVVGPFWILFNIFDFYKLIGLSSN